MSNDPMDNLSKLMKNMPVEMNIFEEGIDYTLLGDFYATLQSLSQNNKEEKKQELDLSFEWQQLTDDSARKKNLAQCAILGTVDAFRKIEDFLKEANGEMRRWAQLALLHCRLHLENDLLDHPIGYIASGLGGKDNKLRYYFAVILQQPFTEAMANFAIESYYDVCTEYDAEVEEAIVGENYLLMRILGPFGHTLSNIIEAGIERNDFIKPYYYVTNLRKPTDEDIKTWIKDCETDGDEEDEEDNEGLTISNNKDRANKGLDFYFYGDDGDDDDDYNNYEIQDDTYNDN